MTRPIEIDARAIAWNNERPMECTLALIADAANISREGKLNVLGVFTNINTPKLPVVHPEMVFVLSFEASPAEANMDKKVEIKMLTEDGDVVGGLEGNFKLPPPAASGERIRIQQILKVNNAVFPKEGPYSLAIMVNGETAKEIRLSVTVVKGTGQ